MQKADIFVQDQLAGFLIKNDDNTYVFQYEENYLGPPVSLTMPVNQNKYTFSSFPPFFDGLLPEGVQLEALLRREKLDKKDYMNQLITVGADLVGDVNVKSSR